MLAREPVAWGATPSVLTPDNLTKARLMCEAFDDGAGACAMRQRGVMLAQFLLEPFHDPAMRQALAAILALALSAGPIGVFVMLRRMSLIGDAMSHAILPGVAIGFLSPGSNVYGMTLGGLAAGLVIALARRRRQPRHGACRKMPRSRCFS